MTLQIKLIILAILLGIVGYSYYWTYSQGRINGQASEVGIQAQKLSEALQKQEKEFHDLRAAEMRAASETASELNRNMERKVKDLDNANKTLKLHPDLAVITVPTDVVRLLNASRGNIGTPEG